MYLPSLKHLSQVVLQKKVFEYSSMYFYGLNPGPLAWGLAIPRAITWTNLVRDHQAMLPTEFEAPESSGSEEEYVFEYFVCISMI